MVRQDLFFQLPCWKVLAYSCLFIRGIGVNTLAPRLQLAICIPATIFAVAVALAFAQAPAGAEVSHTVVLNPTKHTSGQKFGFASGKWIAIKADKEAAVIVVETATGSAVQVTNGTVTVRNLSDKSVVRLSQGCAYETVVRADVERRQPEAFLSSAAETIALFQSKSNTSYLYRMDGSSKFKAEIVTPPITQNYSIGDVAAMRLPISRLVSVHFPPSGVVVWHPPTPALAEEGKSQ